MNISEEETKEHSDFFLLFQITEVLIVCNAEAFHQFLPDFKVLPATVDKIDYLHITKWLDIKY